ncbi:carboxylating nicotinate-nucleotide diphosphorylase [Prosthecochloris vibrioformis]|uniref:Probable nicotinate-nucleotide pyrophosphorylase [carboxylating] n=1 Tax=Prosthecochloris vibrioformis TaxID=1098 RepID=A0A5C4S427_PROVB|nr:carboxylating nicotinate-nucleotide diphosphorylase [Prosthecochloris vibrioformis]TNJ37867.1 carboxylating nicotinate-nucleotide diphosphorylase [Prosthecochloris vibrioformis]
MKQRDFQDFFEMCRTRAIMQALEEDRYDGDVTTIATICNGEGGRAVITAKAEGVVAGLGVARQVFSLMDNSIKVSTLSGDGDRVVPGDVVMEVEGSIASLLVAERTALNFMQRMSGIATRTREFVDRIGHTGAKILDTRKTAPGLRYFDKEAVAAGGGKNHRFGLFDLVLIKDNHIDAAGGVGEAVRRAKAYLAEQGISMKIEAEVRSFDELALALDAGPDIVLIDNFAVEDIGKAVAYARERYPDVALEASGNVGLHNVAALAETGVDYISVGELTHSVTALDLSMTIALEK